MKKTLLLMFIVCLLCAPFSVAEPLTALEYVQSLGVDVSQDGKSPGWRTCIYNESPEEDGLKWCVILFSDDQYCYIVNDAASDFYRQLFYDLVNNYDWEVSICDDQSTELYDRTYGIINDIDKTADNYHDKNAYLDSVRTFLCVPDRAYNGEFLFRGYPWGLSIDHFTDLLAPEICPSHFDITSLPLSYEAIEETDSIQIYDPESDFFLDYAECSDLGYTFHQALIFSDGSSPMAGYPDYTIELSAIPVIQNGRIVDYYKDSIVVSAAYHITYKSPQPGIDIYNDLLNKLTSVYGACTDSISSNSVSVNSWSGTHDTYLQLQHTVLSSGDGGISITYGLSNIKESLYELAYTSMPHAYSNNTDGL